MVESCSVHEGVIYLRGVTVISGFFVFGGRRLLVAELVDLQSHTCHFKQDPSILCVIYRFKTVENSLCACLWIVLVFLIRMTRLFGSFLYVFVSYYILVAVVNSVTLALQKVHFV